MPSNVEIKARVAALEPIRAAALPRSDGAPELLRQEDVFFQAPQGRLKLRVLAPDRGELILYHRPDQPGPKQSSYRIAPTSDPAALRDILAATLPLVGVVRKTRELLRIGQTRVHLDRVEGLGTFVELEVVLRPGQSAGEGAVIAEALMRDLGLDAAQLVPTAYLDLLRAEGRHDG